MSVRLNSHKNQIAVTLIEMLLVVALLAMLVIMGVNTYMHRGQVSKIDKAAKQIQNVLATAQAYYADNGVWPANFDNLIPEYLPPNAADNAWGGKLKFYYGNVPQSWQFGITVNTPSKKIATQLKLQLLFAQVADWESPPGTALVEFVPAPSPPTMPKEEQYMQLTRILPLKISGQFTPINDVYTCPYPNSTKYFDATIKSLAFPNGGDKNSYWCNVSEVAVQIDYEHWMVNVGTKYTSPYANYPCSFTYEAEVLVFIWCCPPNSKKTCPTRPGGHKV